MVTKMSTRCNIAFYSESNKKQKDFDVILYKHYDGYPDGILPVLLPFCTSFQQNRGLSDSQYAGAWCMYEFCKYYRSYTSETDFLGHGITDSIHGDIEYLYKIYPDRLEVMDVKYDKNLNQKFKLVKSIKL